MEIVVALRGPEMEKIITLVPKRVIPFVGTVREDGDTKLGIGLMRPNGELEDFYGPILVRMLIQSWRGWSILHRLTHIWRGTLESCWRMAARDVDYNQRRSAQGLADQLGWEAFPLYREQLLRTCPDHGVMDAMIKIIEENEISLDWWEFQQERNSNRWSFPPGLQAYLKRQMKESANAPDYGETTDMPLSFEAA
jgi:hypothetical protein